MMRRRNLRLVVVGALVVQGLVWTATTAGADAAAPTTTALIQSASTVIYGSESADTFGITVTGQNATGPTGSVTVTDTSTGTTICSGTLVNTSGDVSSAICNLTDSELAVNDNLTTVVATYAGDANNAGSVSTPVQSVTVTAPTQSAQAQNQATVQNLETTYSSELATATDLGQASGLETLTQFEAQVAGLDPTGLAEFYSITQQVPQWDSIPQQMQTIAADVPPSSVPPSASANLSSFIRRPAGSSRTRAVTHAILANASATPSPFTPASCPSAPPEAAIFAAQIVIDVSSSLYNGSQILGEAEILGVDFTEGSAIAALILAVVLGVAQIIHDTLVYLEDLANDCNNANLAGYINNIDNTTVQTYALIAQTDTLVVNLQSTQATTQLDVQNIVNTGLSSFQTTIEQALSVDSRTIQNAAGGDSQGSYQELLTVQTALQNDMTVVNTDESSNGQQVVGGGKTIGSDRSTELSQVLHETDVDAQGLTTLVTKDSQQILNAIQSQSATNQAQYNALLRLQIEQALAGWCPVVPEVKFMLPTSLGGLLNATPASRRWSPPISPPPRPSG